jgi:hypothetical protein
LALHKKIFFTRQSCEKKIMSEQELNENDAEMSVEDEESSKKEDVNASGGDDDESFEDGEEILAYHGNALYKAKIQKVKKQNGESSYFIHYHGWNKKFVSF